jgi:hypothetical protein
MRMIIEIWMYCMKQNTWDLILHQSVYVSNGDALSMVFRWILFSIPSQNLIFTDISRGV